MKFALVVSLFILADQGQAQIKPLVIQCDISGPTALHAGDVATFTLNGPCQNTATSWNTSCGNITGSGSNAVTVNISQPCPTITISAYNGSTLLKSKTFTIIQPPLLEGGIISNSSQTINNGTAPALLNTSIADGGYCPSGFSYSWFYSTDNSNWNGAGSIQQSFQPGILTTTTYFRRQVFCGFQNAYTNTATVNVYPAVNPGTITPPNGIINYNTPAPNLTVSGMSGGNNSFHYQWQSSSNASTWTNVGSDAPGYSPGNLTASTFFRVGVSSNGSTPVFTVNVLINVWPQLVLGTLGSAQWINYNTSATTALTVSGTTGGDGNYTYQWFANNGSGYQPVSGPITASYTPGPLTVTTTYKVTVTSNGVTTPAGNEVTVTVYPQLISGTISPASQTIAAGTTPAPMSISNPMGGTGTNTWQWWSDAMGTFLAISGATGTTYYPGQATATIHYYVVTSSNGVSVTSPTATVSILPPVYAGVLSPSDISIAPGTSPGLLTCTKASGGNCSGSFMYQWQSSPDNINWSDVGTNQLSYLPGPLSVSMYYRLQVTCGLKVYSNVCHVTVASQPTDYNYIRTRMISKPGMLTYAAADGLTDPRDVQQVTQYFDGLGRPNQAVSKQASPQGKDLVAPQVYDNFGRESTHYLPYVSPTADGNYKPNFLSELTTFNSGQYSDEQFYYGTTVFEPSPLDRPLFNYSAGNSWVGNGIGAATAYQLNTAADSVQIWNIALLQGGLPSNGGVYPDGQLFRAVTTDEQQHQVIEFKDISGNVVLKKVQSWDIPAAGHSGWLCTYYVYDDLNNLRFVMQPRAVELISAGGWSVSQTVADELCFRYEYDTRKRMVIKKVPGAGENWMVYDARDRVVMTQDSLMRSLHNWRVMKYDNLNREDSMGILTDANNRVYHQSLAGGSITYPIVNTGNYAFETTTFYDDYGWMVGYTSRTNQLIARYTSNPYYFIPSGSGTYPYAMPLTQSMATRGMVTGTVGKVYGIGFNIITINKYDDRGRLIQAVADNFSNTVDTVTTQYAFTGSPLRVLYNHADSHNGGIYHKMLTKMNYDAAMRPKATFKNLDSAAVDQLIDSLQYNELGQLRAKYLGSNLDSEVYAYNIRGWLTSINKNYMTSTAGTSLNYFGMELGYDKNTAAITSTSYTGLQYNGNIAGTMWKSAGDGVARQYDFSYDNVNRLVKADFKQLFPGGWGKSDPGGTGVSMDFSTTGLSYDANGNILTMKQSGFKLGGSVPIDELSYSYKAASNKLDVVTDAANDATSALGDFHYTGTKGSGSDYQYDGNGNLVSDRNKGINKISYFDNNLPNTILFGSKGQIQYNYDANGNKVRKSVFDSLSRHVTVTFYLGPFVYQYIDTITNPIGVNWKDSLEFVGTEEGRARWAMHHYTNGTSAYKWEYDFFEKDHLGNTRVLLTQEKDTTQYLATMEAANRQTENALFYNLPDVSFSRAAIPPTYPTDNTTNPNDSVMRLNGSGPKVGAAIILKVMAGDQFDLSVKHFYHSGGAPPTPNSDITNLLTSLASGIVAISAPTHGTFSALSNPTSSPLLGPLNSYANTKDVNPSDRPKAYLNWILLDNQLQSADSKAYPLGDKLILGTIGETGITVKKSGYLYIWVSNETPGWDVFFDNLSIVHRTGPMVEEEHYYPFGLSMSGISDRAIKSNYAENKYRGNGGSELQNKEFSDGSGLEAYDANFRMYDPQIGRFWQIDPLGELAESWSPYSFVLDNPLSFNDPLGLTDSVAGLLPYAPAPVITPLHVHTPNNQSPSPALIGTPPGGVDIPAAPTDVPDIPINSPTDAPTGEPVNEPLPPGPPVVSPLALGLTAVFSLIPITGNTDWSDRDELFYKKHPEFLDRRLTPSAKNKSANDLYLVRFGDEMESKERLASDAAKAQAGGLPYGVSTFLRSKAPVNGRSARLLDVMRRFEIKKTGTADHFTVVLPNPVTQQTAIDFNLLFIKR